MHVFWKQGYAGTALADLEAATQLGRQSLYATFGDKRALFERVVERYFDVVFRRAFIDELEREGPARANLERVFATWQAAAETPGFNGCLLGNSASELALHDQELATLVARKLRLTEDAFTRAITRGQREGSINATRDPRTVARSLVTLAQGLAVVARVQRDPEFTRAVIQSARALLD